MDEIKRYLIPQSEEEVLNAFKQAVSIISETDTKKIVLLTPTRNIEDGDIEDFLGPNKTKKLVKDKFCILNEGITLIHETNQTFRVSKANNAIIIGIYASKKMLDLIDDSKNAIAVIVAPGFEDKYVTDWINTWDPQIFGAKKEEKVPKKIINNYVVENALNSLTRRLKRSKRVYIGGNLDKESTTQLFSILVKNGETYDPVSVRQWAVKHEWTSESADKLEDIAQAVLDGKKIRKGKYPHWKSNIIDTWRES